MSATPEREQADLGARLRAAQLQERLGFSVSAATSNDWQGAYCIVDFDSLEALAAAVSRLEAEAEALKVARAAVDELTEQVIEAEGRERELARALEAATAFRTISDLNRAREVLAGGGRTPDGPMGVTTSGAEKANILNLPVPVRYRSGTGPDGLDSRGGGAAVAEAGPPVVPCRGVLRFTFASTEDNAFDDAVFDMLIAALDSVGAFFECGSAEQMVPADVIPESPLAVALTTATVSPPESVSPGAADVAEAGETRVAERNSKDKLRLSIDVERDGLVRDDSLVSPLGRVLAVVDHGDGRQTLRVEIDGAQLRRRLDEKRPVF